MSDLGKRTIYVGAGVNNATPLNMEGVAVSAMLPGTLLKPEAAGLDASGDAATVFGTLPIFADKDQMRTKSVDDAWTIAENMVGIVGRSGDFLNVLVATTQTLIVGDPLVSNAAGLLTKGTGASTQHVICVADEALTTSGTTLVRVRIA